MKKTKAKAAKTCCPCHCHKGEKTRMKEMRDLVRQELDKRLQDPEFLDTVICAAIEKLGITLAAGGVDTMQSLVLNRLISANEQATKLKNAVLRWLKDEWRTAHDGSGRHASVKEVLRVFNALGREQTRTENAVFSTTRLSIMDARSRAFMDVRPAPQEPDWTRWWEVPLEHREWHKHKEANKARKTLGYAYENQPYEINRQTGRYLLGSTTRGAVLTQFPHTRLPHRLMDYELFAKTFPDIAAQLGKEARQQDEARQREEDALDAKQPQESKAQESKPQETKQSATTAPASQEAKNESPKNKAAENGPAENGTAKNGPAGTMFDGAFDKTSDAKGGRRAVKFGSSRWPSGHVARHHIEHCLAISTKMLREYGLIGKREAQGAFRCVDPFTGLTENIGYRWRHVPNEMPELVLEYVREVPGAGEWRVCKLHRLTCADKWRGGQDYYFECPVSGERAHFLYLPAYALEFGTKKEHNLDYASKYIKRSHKGQEQTAAV